MKGGDPLLLVLAFCREAVPERRLDLLDGLGIDGEPLQQFPQLGHEVEFRNVRAGADLATVLPARAAVVDVLVAIAVLLPFGVVLGRDPASAVAARGQPPEGKLPVCGGLGPAKHRLHPVEEALRDEGLVLPHEAVALPGDEPIVKGIREHLVDSALADGAPFERVIEALFPSDFDELVEGIAARAGELPEPLHDGRTLLVEGHVAGRRVVQVSIGSDRRPASLLDLLVHALPDLFGEVVDVVPGEDGLNVEPELVAGSRLLVQDEAGLIEMKLLIVDLDELVELVHVVEIASRAVGLLEDDPLDRGVGLDEPHHFSEGLPARGLSRLGDDPAAHDLKVVPLGVLLAFPLLDVRRVTFKLPVIGDPGV